MLKWIGGSSSSGVCSKVVLQMIVNKWEDVEIASVYYYLLKLEVRNGCVSKLHNTSNTHICPNERFDVILVVWMIFKCCFECERVIKV